MGTSKISYKAEGCIKAIEFFVQKAKEENVKKVGVAERIIKLLNEKLVDELRVINIINRIGVIMEITNVIQKKEARDRVEAFVGEMERAIATFQL